MQHFVTHGCHRGVTNALKGCYKGVTWGVVKVLEGKKSRLWPSSNSPPLKLAFSGTRVSQWCYRSAIEVLHGVHKSVQGAGKPYLAVIKFASPFVPQWYYGNVTVVLQWCHRSLTGRYKDATWELLVTGAGEPSLAVIEFASPWYHGVLH
jgi:hypothetical protein